MLFSEHFTTRDKKCVYRCVIDWDDENKRLEMCIVDLKTNRPQEYTVSSCDYFASVSCQMVYDMSKEEFIWYSMLFQKSNEVRTKNQTELLVKVLSGLGDLTKEEKDKFIDWFREFFKHVNQQKSEKLTLR